MIFHFLLEAFNDFLTAFGEDDFLGFFYIFFGVRFGEDLAEDAVFLVERLF